MKAKQYNISDFVDKSDVGLKLVSKKITKNTEGVWDGQFSTDKIVIMNLYRITDNNYSIKYFDGSTELRTNIPGDFKVIRLLKVTNKKLFQDYWNYKFTYMDLKLDAPVGSDPEIFVEDKAGGIIPAFNFLGSKSKPDLTPIRNHVNNSSPLEVDELPMYWDGFQAEFVTREASCLAWQIDSIQCGLRGVLQKAKTYNPDAKLSTKTVMSIDPIVLRDSKEEHVEFGCLPSFNIYNMKGLSIPGRDVSSRFAGGHIHFGIGKRTEKEITVGVKALDAILGVACVSLFQNYDNVIRRKFYGLAGEYRLPPHGLEYRVLSNAWLFHPLIANVVFDVARRVLKFGLDGFSTMWKAKESEVIEVINNCDVKGAQAIIERNKDVFMKILATKFGDNSYLIYNIFMNGMESAVINPNDIEGNWNLNTQWVGHSDGVGKNYIQAIPLLEKNQKVS